MVAEVGLEPTAPRFQGEYSCQTELLRVATVSRHVEVALVPVPMTCSDMAHPPGFEPGSCGFGDRCVASYTRDTAPDCVSLRHHSATTGVADQASLEICDCQCANQDLGLFEIPPDLLNNTGQISGGLFAPAKNNKARVFDPGSATQKRSVSQLHLGYLWQ